MVRLNKALLSTESIALEFSSGNIMTKAKESDVSLRLIGDSHPEVYCHNQNCTVSQEYYYHILYKGKYVGDMSVTRIYDAVMDDNYDSYDIDCYNNPEEYVNILFNYLNDGDIKLTHIDRIDIKESYQNLGIGTAILKKYFRGATLSPDNADAQRLYARLGHEYDGTEDAIYGLDAGYGVYEIE